MTFRVGIAGLVHETNVFTPVRTSFDDFTWFYARGTDLIARFRDTNSQAGGFLAGAAEEGFEVAPATYRAARPSGPVSAQDFERLVVELVSALEEAGPIAGLLLDLHGSMVAEGCDDCESEILRRVRELVGGIPIVAQLDIHANLSEAMVEGADLLVGRRTYPEVDMAARGRDCAKLLGQLLRGEAAAAPFLYRLPLVWGTAQATGHGAMKELMGRLDDVLAEPGVLTACILPGFRWADSPVMGSSVYVATNDDPARSRELAEGLAGWIVERTGSWYEELPSTAEAIEAARDLGRYPVVLADYLDNPGSGAPGDGTAMLRAFLGARLEDACVLYLVDPASVQRCIEAGVGATVALRLGGHSHPAQGPPVEADGEVKALSDGDFTYTTLSAGLKGNLGPSALVRVDGVHCVVVSRHEQPLDPGFAESLGLDCRAMRWIGLKSKQHFRAGFESFAGLVQLVEEPNVNGPALEYRRLGRALYPLTSDTVAPVVAWERP